MARGPVFVAGRYRKLGRNISNSPWLPGKCVTSVSEELARGLLPAMRADSYKFNAAGELAFFRSLQFVHFRSSKNVPSETPADRGCGSGPARCAR